jgi:hypothetical protein
VRLWVGWLGMRRHAQSWAWLTYGKVGMGQGARLVGMDGVGFSLPTWLVPLHGLRQSWHGSIRTKCLGSGMAFEQAWKAHDGTSDLVQQRCFHYYSGTHRHMHLATGWTGGQAGMDGACIWHWKSMGPDGMAWHGITTRSFSFLCSFLLIYLLSFCHQTPRRRRDARRNNTLYFSTPTPAVLLVFQPRPGLDSGAATLLTSTFVVSNFTNCFSRNSRFHVHVPQSVSTKT